MSDTLISSIAVLLPVIASRYDSINYFDNGNLNYSLNIIAALVLITIVIWSLFWLYSDAIQRGKSNGIAIVMTVLLIWPFGLLYWLLFRPKKYNQK
jgi:hypothetical protein